MKEDRAVLYHVFECMKQGYHVEIYYFEWLWLKKLEVFYDVQLIQGT